MNNKLAPRRTNTEIARLTLPPLTPEQACLLFGILSDLSQAVFDAYEYSVLDHHEQTLLEKMDSHYDLEAGKP